MSLPRLHLCFPWEVAVFPSRFSPCVGTMTANNPKPISLQHPGKQQRTLPLPTEDLELAQIPPELGGHRFAATWMKLEITIYMWNLIHDTNEQKYDTLRNRKRIRDIEKRWVVAKEKRE